jgi:prophage maintenance system killer protein
MKQNNKDNSFPKGEVVIYQDKVGKASLEVKLEQETVWLTQKRMADLFGVEVNTINYHIKEIFSSGELKENSVIRKFRITAADGKDYLTQYYSLDMIISVGYKVNSRRATQFRIWATNVLKRYIVQGYTLNQKRLNAQTQKINELQEAVRLLGNVATLGQISDEAKGIIQIISEYSRALGILDDYDHERLSAPKGTGKELYVLTYDAAIKLIKVMKQKFSDSQLVGQERDQSFKSSLGAVYQSFAGKDVYRTVEEKAAHLLYFVTKNHSFVDGNKRIAAALFVCFLQKNRLLLRKDGAKRIDDGALAALTLMVAASKPAEKDMMIKVILNLLR